MVVVGGVECSIAVGVACDGERLVDAGAVGVSGFDVTIYVEFEQDVFIVVDVAGGGAVKYPGNPSPVGVVLVLDCIKGK